MWCVIKKRVCTHVSSSTGLSQKRFKLVSRVDAAQRRRVPDASHMHEEFQRVFTLDPGQSVASKGVCVYTPNREREGICVKERQSEGSKRFDKFSQCR